MAAGITDLTDATFDEEVGSSSLPVLVDFWAEWCAPCRMLMPVLEQLAAENGERLRVTKLNVDDSPDIARRFEILTIPTLLLFKDGVLKKQLRGAKGKRQLLEELAEFLA